MTSQRILNRVPPLKMRTAVLSSKRPWPVWALIVATLVGAVPGVADVSLPLGLEGQWERLGEGAWRVVFILLIARYVVGRLRREINRGWIAYSLLIATSVFWFMYVWSLLGKVLYAEDN